ncbi:hypothetical protein AAVH_21178 [Aphelenchoides avenae]|nr:hypothetical protein AAVH_21178 [Aphelenchus avenae]
MNMNGGHVLPIDVTNAFEHDELFPLKFYEGYQLRINEVFQKAAEALEALEKQGRHPPFLQPCNIRFIASEDAAKGRYTGFDAKAEIVDNGMALAEAKKCEETRELLAPEILDGKPITTTSASYSIFRMYYNALKSKLRLRETPDRKFHFVEKATMHKGPMTETGWWELNPFIMEVLRGGLNPDPEKRLPIEAFTRLFKRTSDDRYVDSRMCVDAFDPLDYQSSREADWFRDQQSSDE